jgi:hypothetical protein
MTPSRSKEGSHGSSSKEVAIVKTICDRCEKVVENETPADLVDARNWSTYENRVFRILLPVFEGTLYTKKYLDICQECIRSLVTWVQKGREPDDR